MKGTSSEVEVAGRGLVKLTYVSEHVTAGKQALKIECEGGSIKNGKAFVYIQVLGSQLISSYVRLPVAGYWPHYRWLKFDAFNPGAQALQVRVNDAPFVLAPGASVVALKTTDGVGGRGENLGMVHAVTVAVTAPAADAVLFIDHFRMEQESLPTFQQQGRLFQFPAREDAKSEPVLWPGFTPVDIDTLYSEQAGFGWTAPRSSDARNARGHGGHSFRSHENGLLWGYCGDTDCPFRVDLPRGRYGIYCFATPSSYNYKTFDWKKGGTLKINGQEHVLIEPRNEEELRQAALSGETWDYRPGACVWEGLMRKPFYPETKVVHADAAQGHLLLEFSKGLMLRGIFIFPEQHKDAALKELGRFNYLLAESWDVSHPWVKGDAVERLRYIGFHAEATQPESIPERLKALSITAPEFERGFVLFERDLTDAVYPDTIPGPAESRPKKLACFAASGESECVTLGILPLAEQRGLKMTLSDFQSKQGQRIPAAVRCSRYHQKTMQYGHHNYNYNYNYNYEMTPKNWTGG